MAAEIECLRDDELLGQGLELNDSLQTLLAKHDAIGSGSPIPTQVTSPSAKPTEACASGLKSTEVSDSSSRPKPNGNHPAPVASVTKALIDEEEEEEEDFAQLARRHSKPKPMPSQNTSVEAGGTLVPVNKGNATTLSMPADTAATPCNALALPNPPAPVKTTNEQDIIDLLGITLSTSLSSPPTPQTPSASNQSTHQVPAPQALKEIPMLPKLMLEIKVRYHTIIMLLRRPSRNRIHYPHLSYSHNHNHNNFCDNRSLNILSIPLPILLHHGLPHLVILTTKIISLLPIICSLHPEPIFPDLIHPCKGSTITHSLQDWAMDQSCKEILQQAHQLRGALFPRIDNLKI